MSLMNSSLLLYKGPACLIRLILIVTEMDGRWPGWVYLIEVLCHQRTPCSYNFVRYTVCFLSFPVQSHIFQVRSTKSRQIINGYGSNVYPCRTLATISKKSVSPFGERNMRFLIYLTGIFSWLLIFLDTKVNRFLRIFFTSKWNQFFFYLKEIVRYKKYKR